MSNQLADLAGEHDIVVTPHHLRPLPRDGRTPTESDFLATGIYNLGFIGTGDRSPPQWVLRVLESRASSEMLSSTTPT